MVKETLFKNIPLFLSFKKSELRVISRIAETETYPKGATIFKEGEIGDALYIIISGEVVIEKQPLIKATGTIVTLNFKEGDFFGELSLFDAGPRTSTASTLKDTRLVVLKRSGFLRMLKANPAVSSWLFQALIKIIASRIRQMNNELMAFYEVGRLLSLSKPIDYLLDNVLEIITQAATARCGMILLENNITGSFEPKAIKGYKEEKLRGVDFSHEASLSGYAIKRGEPQIIPDSSLEFRTKEFMPQGHERKTMLFFPFGLRGNIIGLIVIADKKEEPKKKAFFNANDINLVSAITRQIEAALENIQFRTDAESITKQKRRYFKF